LSPNKLFLSYSLIKRIKEVTGEEFSWKHNTKEGWKIEKFPDTHFSYYVTFDNEDAKLLFLLKYGNGK
jgi:hypothetical protein